MSNTKKRGAATDASNNLKVTNGSKETTQLDATTQATKDHICGLRSLLGRDPVLLPVPHGTKACQIKGWPNTKYSDTVTPEYEAQLRQGNIGVLFGEPSNHLCAIDIDCDDAVEPFLALNPSLKETLRSRGARGVALWVRMTGEYPKTTKLTTAEGTDWGEWRSTGAYSVIHGIHPSGNNYTIQVHNSPAEMGFGDIVWPEGLIAPFIKTDYERFVEEHGQPMTVSADGKVHDLNHLFFIKRFMLREQIIYDPLLNALYFYTPQYGLWEEKTETAIKKMLLDDLSDVAKTQNLRGLHLKRNSRTANELIALLKIEAGRDDAFKNRPEAIHVANGMICFSGSDITLESFHPDYLSRNMCPYEIDIGAECPRFKKELLETALSADDILLIQKFAGACLMGRNDAQKILLVQGTPGGGKSTLMNVIEEVIGRQNIAELRVEQLGGQFEMADFIGKTLLSGKDVSADFLRNKSVHKLKALVGGDMISAERKGVSNHVTIRGCFNVAITSNADQCIRLQGDVGAWRRRFMVVRYDRPATTRPIPNLARELLETEGPGILKWMLQGAALLLKDLKEIGTYRMTEAQKEQVEKMLEQSDSLRKFIKERIVERINASTPIPAIKEAYYSYCSEQCWLPLAMNEVGKQLEPLMLEIHHKGSRHDKGPRFYSNLGILGGEGCE